VNKNEYVYIGIIGALLIHAVVLVVLNLTPMRAPAEAPVFVEVGFSTEEIEIDERTFEEVMAERVNEQIANLTADANSERSAERMNFLPVTAPRVMPKLKMTFKIMKMRFRLNSMRKENRQEKQTSLMCPMIPSQL